MNLRHAYHLRLQSALRLHQSPFLDQPVFVVACGRSGSTALCEGIARHPQVLMSHKEALLIHKFGEAAETYGCGENEYCRENVAIETQQLWRELRELCYRSALGPTYGLYYSPFKARRRESIFGINRRIRYWGAKAFPDEKAAQGLLWLFPGTKFVYLFRNGLEVVHSMTKFGSFSRLEFEDRCRFWSDRVFRYDYLRQHGRAITVRFEDFVENNEETFERIFNHLDLPSDRGPADFTSSTTVHPLDKPTAQGNVKSILSERPPPYADWNDEQKAIFSRVCSEAMALLDYEMPF